MCRYVITHTMHFESAWASCQTATRSNLTADLGGAVAYTTASPLDTSTHLAQPRRFYSRSQVTGHKRSHGEHTVAHGSKTTGRLGQQLQDLDDARRAARRRIGSTRSIAPLTPHRHRARRSSSSPNLSTIHQTPTRPTQSQLRSAMSLPTPDIQFAGDGGHRRNADDDPPRRPYEASVSARGPERGERGKGDGRQREEADRRQGPVRQRRVLPARFEPAAQPRAPLPLIPCRALHTNKHNGPSIHINTHTHAHHTTVPRPC